MKDVTRAEDMTGVGDTMTGAEGTKEVGDTMTGAEGTKDSIRKLRVSFSAPSA